MAAGSISRRYARAVLDLGAAQNNLDKLGSDLRDLAQAMTTSPELVSSLSNPALRRADRKRILDALLTRIGAHATSKNVVYLLLDRERLGELPAISREVDAQIEAKAGRVTAEVTSAVDLTAAQVTQLTSQLEKLSGKKVQLERKKDPTLLGGLVAKVGDVVYDGSVRTQLRALRDELGK
ncbi:MAG: ATP synthase F1 subunit delta [Deltaproteobacteria bacterium]|nr:ATP synthase F1 subunit delta [Deltaproteobacteria bacterium]